jgi:hypothetical protein
MSAARIILWERNASGASMTPDALGLTVDEYRAELARAAA